MTTKTRVASSMLQDERLSLEARGLLGSLMSRQASVNSVKLAPASIQAMHGIGRDKTYKLINELIDAGYCSTHQARLPNGRMGPTEYRFTDHPERDSK
jgi:hypothetical protein